MVKNRRKTLPKFLQIELLAFAKNKSIDVYFFYFSSGA